MSHKSTAAKDVVYNCILYVFESDQFNEHSEEIQIVSSVQVL